MPKRPDAPSADDLLRLLLDQGCEYALFLLSRDGIITDWYAGAQHVFGWSADEMVGEPITRLFHPEDIERGAPDYEMAVARSAGHAEDDRWHIRKDGSRFWASGALFALHGTDGGLCGFAKIVRNRTDVKTQTEALENQVKALAESNRQKDVFLGVLGHELRNPLQPLGNAAAMLRALNLGPAVADALGIIDRQLAQLRRLAEDLLDTSRIGAGKVDIRLEEIDLCRVVREAGEAARAPARARKHALDIITVKGPVRVKGDAQRLQQVFGNLLDNAIKYTPPGGKVILNLTTEGGDAIVRVEDTGIGMSADVLPRIFDLFTQEDAAVRVSSRGVGLGLALVRELVQLHGGTVQARSDGRDKGSVFTVRLPMPGATQP